MKTLIFILILVGLSVVINSMILAKSLDGELQVVDEKQSLSDTEVNQEGKEIDPEYDYYVSYRLKKQYSKTSFITWSCKTDTLSRVVLREKKKNY